MELVTRETPFGEPPRSSRRSFYRLADPFLRLWFRVVSPNRALLVRGTAAQRYALWARHRAPLVSQTWEDLCRRALPRLPELGAWEVPVRAFGSGGPEWDVVARGVNDASGVMVVDGRAVLDTLR